MYPWRGDTVVLALVAAVLLAPSFFFFSLSSSRFVQAIDWQTCPTYTDASYGSSSDASSELSMSLHGKRHFQRKLRERWNQLMDQQHGSSRRVRRDSSLTTQCASERVLLNAADPNSGFIDIFIKCYVKSSTSTGQFWFLQGGPGYSSYPMEPFMTTFANSNVGDQFDVCTLDFRGVYRSSVLACEAAQAETTGSPGSCDIVAGEATECHDELNANDTLNYFLTTQAADDLHSIISNYTPAKSKIAIVGYSYGTYWLARLAKLYPSFADILIFDSVVNPSGNMFVFDDWDVNNDMVIRDYLTLCGKDDFCSSMLGDDPVSFAKDALDSVYKDSSSCSDFVKIVPTRGEFVQYLQTFLQSLYTRPLITAFFFRIDKCRSEDIAFFKNVLPTSSNSGLCDQSSSYASYLNVIAAELITPGMTVDKAKAKDAALDFSGDVVADLVDQALHWHTLDHTYFNQSVKPTGKVLILNGDLDGQTPFPYAQNFYDNLKANGVTAYLGKGQGSGHIVTESVSKDGSPCGVTVITDFVLDPSKSPDMSCLSDLQTFDFKGANESLNQQLFGVSCLYNGAPTDPDQEIKDLEIALIVVAVTAVIFAILVIILLVVHCRSGNVRPASSTARSKSTNLEDI